MTLPILASKHGIASREQFRLAVTAVNELAKREELSAEEAKAAKIKTDALRAWASFDKRLSDADKKEANRATARVMRILADIAEREAPVKRTGHGMIAGPVRWLQTTLGVSQGHAKGIRNLKLNPDAYRVTLSSGRHWFSVVQGSGRKKHNRNFLTKFNTETRRNNTLELAIATPPLLRGQVRRTIRQSMAWLQAYEAALIQLDARDAKA